MGKGAERKLFEQVAIPLLSDVYRVARQMADETRAQDLVQETYMRAWKYFSSFDQGTSCRSWLFRILHNVWRDQWRRTQAEVSLTEYEDTSIEPYYDWEDCFIDDEPSPEFAKALSQVPELYRWAILLRDVEELSYQEIAQVMNCPAGTVMSRINRGRRSLARLLRNYSSDHQTKPTELSKRGS